MTIETSSLVRRKERGVGEELLEPGSLIVPAVFEKHVKQFEGREQIIFFQKEIHDAIAERRFLYIHGKINEMATTFFLFKSKRSIQIEALSFSSVVQILQRSMEEQAETRSASRVDYGNE
ncbi:hypothetical protein H6P81_010430 [Aristolochia fimbriata]|uniref:Uncharacterized protein n=1 Tax=Aristolochia fimbriata TaxID=158543 RepID=A0AAV7ENQ9_ARIFI|nr:hypothetical protein H6P81_010430 [Aristolochia fimbriata]